jgi:hypothetical protein
VAKSIAAGIFSRGFDDEFAVGLVAGNSAFFGRDVLRGLVDGIDDLAEARQPRWTRFRSLGPVLLGSAMWIDDEALLEKLNQLSGVCIVVRKERRNHPKLERLAAVDARLPGLPIRAFHELDELAPKVDGSPLVVGPYSSMGDQVVTAIRSIGYRARQDSYVPIVHAKLALLGHLWWHDEGASGGVEDVVGFEPKRLWISSANFTRASRASLEFGFWTEDGALMAGTRRFLIRLIASSEPINAESDVLDPEFVPVQYDDEAMAAALAEYGMDDE